MDPELKNYIDRHRVWQDYSIKQMSFFNNLLIFISIGFLGFLTRDELFKTIHLNCHESFHFQSCVFVSSLISALLSVFYGFLTALSRLYDFRISRNIALTRLRIYKGKNWQRKNIKTYTIDEEIGIWKRNQLLVKVIFNKFRLINSDDVKKLAERDVIQERNFEILSKVSTHLGKITWKYLRLQVLFFFIAFVFYFLSYLHFVFTILLIVIGLISFFVIRKAIKKDFYGQL